MNTASSSFTPAFKSSGYMASAASQPFYPGVQQAQAATEPHFNPQLQYGGLLSPEEESGIVTENRMSFMKSQKDCECCHGMINNCGGKACDNLGVC